MVLPDHRQGARGCLHDANTIVVRVKVVNGVRLFKGTPSVNQTCPGSNLEKGLKGVKGFGVSNRGHFDTVGRQST